jgi:hypothetical protein
MGNAVPKFIQCHNHLQEGQEIPSTFNLGNYSVDLGERGEDVQNE